MREIRVDFAEARPTPAWFTSLALAILLPVIAWQVWHLVELESQLRATRDGTRAIQQTIEQLKSERKEAEDRARDTAQTPEARTLAAIREFPLNDVLTSIESSRMEGVRLMAFDIAPAEGSVRLECEYASLEKLLQYVSKLNETSSRMRWQISSARGGAGGGSGGGAATVIARLSTRPSSAAAPVADNIQHLQSTDPPSMPGPDTASARSAR